MLPPHFCESVWRQGPQGLIHRGVTLARHRYAQHRYVLMTAGLLRQINDEDELAYVLAHEIAHVAKRHHYKVVQRQRLAEQAAKGLQSMGSDEAQAQLSQASGQIYARGLDKNAEYEADRIGAEVMMRAGFDPAPALSVLEGLQRLQGDDPRAELLFSTHPTPSGRLDMLLQSGIDLLPRPAAKGVQMRKGRFQTSQKQI